MTTPISVFPSATLQKLLAESARRSSAAHCRFLQVRRAALQDMRALIEMQIHAADQVNTAIPAPLARPAIFDSRQLDAFGVGEIANCLGPAFAKYAGRRIPRIPNGDLKMMSRVTAISGTPSDFSQPASVVVEYDVPVDAWYLKDNSSPQIPTSLYMEIALQPCGFLSAYLDTYALVPYGEFYFRNLDGSLQMLAQVDPRGKTITTQANLLTSVVSSGTVVQKYAFEIECQGQVICRGESLFGYFSAESMANQLGLDGGRPSLPMLRANAQLAGSAQVVDLRSLQTVSPARPSYHLAQGRLNFLNQVSLVRSGGKYGQGYVYASRPVNPNDWFYPYHFYQDPVMPGSLGVEAILEAMQAYALVNDLGAGLHAPCFTYSAGSPALRWRYRGQITQRNRLMELEAHLRFVERQGQGVVLSGDASLWVDGMRIYEVQDAAVAIVEG